MNNKQNNTNNKFGRVLAVPSVRDLQTWQIVIVDRRVTVGV
jgi:hypothetical protein